MHVLCPTQLAAQGTDAQGASAHGTSAPGTSAFGAWFDASGARITQPQHPPRDAAFFGLGAVRDGQLLSLAGQFSATAARDSAGAGQADLVLQFAPPRLPRLRTDLALAAVSYGFRTGSDHGGAVQLRESYDVTISPVTLGVFAAVARGGTTRLDLGVRNAFRAVTTSGGVHATLGVLTLSAEWQRALSDDYALAEAAGYGLRRHASSYDYRDVVLAAGVRWSRLEAGVTRVTRHGGSATTGRSAAHAASASIAIAPWLALVGSTGAYLSDPLRGVPQATVTSLGMRLQRGGRVAARVTHARASHTDARAVSEVAMEARPNGGALVTVRLRARDGERAQVATSVGEWTPIAMQRDGAWWTAQLELPTGTHRIAVRVNDAPWRAPVGTISVRDDFGGSAGLVIVPEY